MGWTFPWYSSFGSDFNYDFHVTHDEAVAPVEYNYLGKDELLAQGEPWFTAGESHGLSVFLRDGERLPHLLDLRARRDLLVGTFSYLDLTPLGRQEDWEEPSGRSDGPFMHWLRRHDRYAGRGGAGPRLAARTVHDPAISRRPSWVIPSFTGSCCRRIRRRCRPSTKSYSAGRSSTVRELNYRIVETGGEGGINGGIMRPEHEGEWPGNMTVYIAVDDLAAYRSRIVAAGGKILIEEQAVPGMGALSLFTDPDGRMMGLWKTNK